MIRHTPHGRGHAYRPSLDQRVPVIPLVGEAVEVRALVGDGDPDPVLEVRTDAGTTTLPMGPAGPPARGAAGEDDGHRAAAAAAGEQVEGMRPVAARLDALEGEVAYRITGADGTATPWEAVTPARWQPDPAAVVVTGPTDRLDPDATEVLVDGTGTVRVRAAFRLADGEHVLGLGERFHALDHRGRRLDTQVFEQYKQQGERTYLPVPFLLVVGGETAWGVHVDTTRRCWFDIGATDHDRLVVEVTVDPADPTAALATWAGTPEQVLDGFTARIGRPADIPRWALRPWGSGNEWNTQVRVEAEVARSIAEDIPLGVIVIEAWADEATFTAFRDATYTPRPDGGPMRLEDFTFPADGAWPDPVGMVRRLHEQGVKVLLWQIPLLPVEVPDDRLGAVQLAHDREVLVQRGFAVQEADGSPYRNRGWWFPGALMPDLTSAAATEWWLAKRRYLVEQVGIDGFKTDGGEHAWGDELRWADGSRGAATNNTFANRYAAAYQQLLADCGREGVTFSRAGWTGAGSVPCHWAGDEDSTWEAFRASILAGLHAGVSGVPAWGFDHGGFSGEVPDPELYLRSAAMAMLCPIMQYHSEFNHHREPCRDRTPWNIAERHDDPSVISTYRRFAHIREALVDHLHEQLRDGIGRGLPLMRPLALAWPQDEAIWDHPHQYMLGEEVLVAPVVEPDVRTWPVHLPAGRWLAVWTEAAHEGPATVTVDAPLEEIPAYVRDTAAGRSVRATIRQAAGLS